MHLWWLKSHYLMGRCCDSNKRGHAATFPSSLASPTPCPDCPSIHPDSSSSIAYKAVLQQPCLPSDVDTRPVHLRSKGKPVGRWLLCSGPLGVLEAGERRSRGRKPPSSQFPTSQSERICFSSCDEVLHRCEDFTTVI